MPVDRRDLVHKTLPVAMFQLQDVFQRPVEMKSDKGYLLEQAVKRVAYDPPGLLVSTSNTFWQAGQVTVWVGLVPSLLI